MEKRNIVNEYSRFTYVWSYIVQRRGRENFQHSKWLSGLKGHSLQCIELVL